MTKRVYFFIDIFIHIKCFSTIFSPKTSAKAKTKEIRKRIFKADKALQQIHVTRSRERNRITIKKLVGVCNRVQARSRNVLRADGNIHFFKNWNVVLNAILNKPIPIVDAKHHVEFQMFLRTNVHFEERPQDAIASKPCIDSSLITDKAESKPCRKLEHAAAATFAAFIDDGTVHFRALARFLFLFILILSIFID